MVKRRNPKSTNSNNNTSSNSRRSPGGEEGDQRPPVGKPGRGRDTKFTHEIGDFIVELTKQLGSKYQAAKMAQIPRSTFHRWMEWAQDDEREDYAVFRDFRERLMCAEEEFRWPKNMDAEALTEKAREEYVRLLFNGAIEVSVVVEEREGENEKLGSFSETVRTTKTTKKGVPSWVLMRQLGMYDGTEAIKTLIGLGVLSPAALDEVESMFDKQVVPSLTRILNQYAIAPSAPDFPQIIESMISSGTLRPEVKEFIEGKSSEELSQLFPSLVAEFGYASA